MKEDYRTEFLKRRLYGKKKDYTFTVYCVYCRQDFSGRVSDLDGEEWETLLKDHEDHPFGFVVDKNHRFRIPKPEGEKEPPTEEPQPSKQKVSPETEPPPQEESRWIKEIKSHNLTEAGNAETFCTIYGDEYRYVPERGSWMKLDKVRWYACDEGVRNSMIQAMRIISDIGMTCQDHAERERMVKWSLRSESNHGVEASLSLAESMLYTKTEEFDKDPYLLCCANGIVDLRTGKFRDVLPNEMFYRCTNVIYDPSAKCPRWLKFLNEIFLGDVELIGFIKRAVGYTLTGSTKEQCVFFPYGTGGNGKTTMILTMETLLGDYAVTVPSSMIKERRGDDTIPNDIARTCGTRFAKCVELKEDIRLNEEKIKSISGEDRVAARFLHREFFEFYPQFKLWIVVNEKPIIRGTNDAIWRRVNLIPYEAKFSEESENCDKDLKEKLKAEIPGILNWAIEGCLEWQKVGLKPPQKVKSETKKYRRESDVIARFLNERTVEEPGAKVQASILYTAFKKWCEANSEVPVTETAFGREMGKKNYQKIRGRDFNFYEGIKIVE